MGVHECEVDVSCSWRVWYVSVRRGFCGCEVGYPVLGDFGCEMGVRVCCGDVRFLKSLVVGVRWCVVSFSSLSRQMPFPLFYGSTLDHQELYNGNR